MSKERIGIFGGSFDPIHIGHLIIASDAAEQMALDRVLFIPAAQAPLKPNAPEATANDRAEMTRLAIEADPRFEVRRFEIDRGGTSFSIDTAEEIAREFPEAELFWIIGGDQARQLDQWNRIDELAKLVEFKHRRTEEPGMAGGRVAQPRVDMNRPDGSQVVGDGPRAAARAITPAGVGQVRRVQRDDARMRRFRLREVRR